MMEKFKEKFFPIFLIVFQQKWFDPLFFGQF